MKTNGIVEREHVKKSIYEKISSVNKSMKIPAPFFEEETGNHGISLENFRQILEPPYSSDYIEMNTKPNPNVL